MSRKRKIETLENYKIKEAEEKLKYFYKQKKWIISNKSRIEGLESQIKEIEEDIKNCNIKFNIDIKAINYSNHRVNGGQLPSGLDKIIVEQIDKMQDERKHLTAEILELKEKNRNLKKEIDKLEKNINMLHEEYRLFIKYMYEEKRSLTWISVEMYRGAYSTANRRKEEMLKNIYDMLVFQKLIKDVV